MTSIRQSEKYLVIKTHVNLKINILKLKSVCVALTAPQAGGQAPLVTLIVSNLYKYYVVCQCPTSILNRFGPSNVSNLPYIGSAL